MGNRAGLLLLLALVSGSLAAFLAFTFIRSPSAPAAVATVRESVPIVVAARDMDVGTTLAAEDVKVVEFPGTSLPVGFASTPDEVIGLGVLYPTKMNEPLLQNKLAGGELGGGMPMLIPDSMRAVAVAVNDVTAVAGWMTPGTKVDVMVTLNEVRGQVEPVTQVFLQNVLVIGNDRSIAQQENGTAVAMAYVTLLLSPTDSEKLTMASTNGRIQFALRNNLDLDTIPTTGSRPSGLLTGGRVVVAASTGPVRAAAPPPPRRSSSIEVIRGADKKNEPVPQRGGGE